MTGAGGSWRLKRHYEQLGIGDRCAIDLHEGGHKVRFGSGIEWLRKWLLSVSISLYCYKPGPTYKGRHG
jgi:hypothetical protein